MRFFGIILGFSLWISPAFSTEQAKEFHRFLQEDNDTTAHLKKGAHLAATALEADGGGVCDNKDKEGVASG